MSPPQVYIPLVDQLDPSQFAMLRERDTLLPTDKEKEEASKEVDIDDWIEAELRSLRMYPVTLEEAEPILEEGSSEELQEIAKYLLTLRKPAGIDQKRFRKWKQEALKFKVQGRQLFRRNTKNIFFRRVFDKLKERQEIIASLHDETGHRGRDPFTIRGTISFP